MSATTTHVGTAAPAVRPSEARLGFFAAGHTMTSAQTISGTPIRAPSARDVSSVSDTIT